MRTALIGYTGFVGSNLLDAYAFDDLYNSSNVAEIAGKEYDLIVSAGNRADSHRINLNGPADLAEVDVLVDTLRAARTNRLVLISTVCVYPGGTSPDETTPLSMEGLTPYGQNRLHQEERLREAFDTTVVRLPQLYGARLKKGVIYDLMHDYRVEHIDPTAQFQYYDVRTLWNDIRLALDEGLSSVNIASPALDNATVAREVFDRDISAQKVSTTSAFSSMYSRDMRTVHDRTFGGTDGYFDTAEQSLAKLREFVAKVRSMPEGTNSHA